MVVGWASHIADQVVTTGAALSLLLRLSKVYGLQRSDHLAGRYPPGSHGPSVDVSVWCFVWSMAGLSPAQVMTVCIHELPSAQVQYPVETWLSRVLPAAEGRRSSKSTNRGSRRVPRCEGALQENLGRLDVRALSPSFYIGSVLWLRRHESQSLPDGQIFLTPFLHAFLERRL